MDPDFQVSPILNTTMLKGYFVVVVFLLMTLEAAN